MGRLGVVRGLRAALAIGALTVAASAQAALLGRDLNGSPGSFEAYFDDVLNITWLADWNYAKTSGFDADGRMDWTTANTTWISSLNAGTGLYGFNDWRLPTVSPVNGSAFQPVFSNTGSTDRGYAKTGSGGGWGLASEMGHLFYVTLGNKGYCTPNDALPGSCVVQTGAGLTNSGPFNNMLNAGYWSGTEYLGNAWHFRLDFGAQDFGFDKSVLLFAVAVRPGDVLAGSVPEPGSLAMLLAGLGALAVARRRRTP